MSIAIKHDSATSTKAFVTWICNMPETVSPENLAGSISVEVLPIQGPEQEGKNQLMYIDPTTNRLWFEYVDRPLNDQEQLAALKAQNAQMMLALVANDLI